MYIGSVRFYKHLIISVFVLVLLLPTSCSVVLFAKNQSLTNQIHEMNDIILERDQNIRQERTSNRALQDQLKSLQNTTEGQTSNKNDDSKDPDTAGDQKKESNHSAWVPDLG